MSLKRTNMTRRAVLSLVAGMSDKDIYNAAGAALIDAQQIESNSIVFYGETNSAS